MTGGPAFDWIDRSIQQEWKDDKDDIEQDFQERLEGLQQNLEQAQKIVGLIARTGMAGGYEQYGDDENRQADVWRNRSVGTGITATIILALVVALTTIQSTVLHQTPSNGDLSGRLLLAAAIGGIAKYMAKQASHHRHRAERARNTQLALASMSAYLEPLDDSNRKSTIEDFAYIFFYPDNPIENPEDEIGPGMASTVRSALAQRRVRTRAVSTKPKA